MKKNLLSLLVLVLFVVYSNESFANVYASGLRISDPTVTDYNLASNIWDGSFADGSGVKIWFIVNEAGVGALTASIHIYILGNSRTINTTAAKGVNSIIWDGYLDGGVPAPVGEYSFSIAVNDPVGHTSFDSVWVASAFYQGPDPDGGTTYGYRGNASVMQSSNASFGSLFVARGSTQTVYGNGFYKYRADGVYTGKVDTVPAWINSCPNEIVAIGDKVFGLAGYGYTGGGYSRGFNVDNNTYVDSLIWGDISVRGLAAYNWLNTITYYTGKSGGTAAPVVLKMVSGGTPTVAADLSSLIAPGNSYIKAVAVDDNQNIYVAFGNASASRKKLAKFTSAGNLVWVDSLDNHGFLGTAIFQSLAIDHKNTLDIGDDVLYALIHPGTETAKWGIYKISLDGSTYTQLVSPLGISTAATSTIINVDAAGNVIWSNGSASERIIQFSPADGPNSFMSFNPNGYKINVLNPVPVELSSFTASVSGNDVVLNWTTATETNNRGFEVERNSGHGWNVIGFINGKGTATSPSSYEFIDRNISGEVSYRLKQVDFNGTFEYSFVVTTSVTTPEGYELSQNYPNPFNPVTNILFALPVDSKVTLQVFNMTGELVATLADDFRTAGQHKVTFDASGFASGTYIYRLTAGNTILTKKMILMK